MSLEDTPGYGCAGPANVNAICDCLGCNIERIASATERIANELAKKSEDACKDIDKCIDKIIEGIDNKYRGATATAQQCRDMARSGMAGTVEYALRCAGVAISECSETCSPGDGGEEGKCCKNCGAEKCVCKNFECVPVEEEDVEKWIGWCNRETLVTAVTRQGQPAPGPGFVQVALADTEQAAAQAAAANCTGQEQRPPLTFPPLPPLPQVTGGLPSCNVHDYISGAAFQRLNAQAVSANMAEGLARTFRAGAALGLEGINVGNIGEVIVGSLQGYFGFNSLVTSEASGHLARALGCNNAQLQNSLQALCSLSSVASYIGFDITPWATPYIYAANAACRQRIATPGEATAAFLANRISAETLDAVHSVHGICHDAVEWNIGAQRSKPIPTELARLRRRKIYDSEQYHSGMRQLGYLEPTTAENLFKLTEQVPTMAEIIRFMVRDADDESLVARFGLDTEFDSKYGAQLKEWSEFQGVSEQHARYDWRAHWSIPSPTQLFEFWRRLRYSPQFGGKEKLKEDISAALIQQDILPYWHEHYFAIQYNPIRLVDIRRAYQIGSMSDDEMTHAYIQRGFSDEVAEQMAKFTRRLRDRAVISERPVKLWLRLAITRSDAAAQLEAQGIPVDVVNRTLDDAEHDFIKSPYARSFAAGDITLIQLREHLSAYGVSDATITQIGKILGLRRKNHTAIAEFEAGLIDRSSAGFMMAADGMDAGLASQLLDKVESSVRIGFLKRCQAGIKSRYLTGEIDKQEAANELVARGTVLSRANQMVDWWGCELKSGEKQVSATTLCEWLSRGSISSVDFLRRLERIGYSEIDAAMMLEDCLIRQSVKATAKAKAEAKEQAQEQNRISRILQQQARQTERYNAQILAANRKAAETKLRREKTLISAADKLTPKCECSTFDAIQRVRAENTRLRDSFGLSIDQSLQVLVAAATEWEGGDLSNFADTVTTIANAIVQENISGAPPTIYIPPNTNGLTVPS